MSYSPNLSLCANPDRELIADIHRFMRPKGSRTEQLFVETFIKPLGVRDDLYGNLHKIVVPDDAPALWTPNVLWSCHTDTVHSFGGFQRVVYDANGKLTLHKDETASCLGADDGAGVWLMMEMIRAGVPGHYIFHYGEERGCEGSRALAKGCPELFKTIQIAIAFDRQGKSDIITKMNGLRVCSDEFATSLMKQLPGGYRMETNGRRTDVAQYREMVPECTNISVGYSAPHMSTESLDTMHLIDLRDHLVKLKVSDLVVKRDPKETFTSTTTYSGNYSTAYAECRPRKFAEIFRDAPELCGEMMEAAGVDFDAFLSFALKQQALKKRHFTSMNRQVIPHATYKDPIPDHPPVAPAAAPVTETPAETTAETKTGNVVALSAAGK